MALERKDFRGKLDPAWHEFMRAIADAEGVTDAEWIERLVMRELRQKAHDVSLLAEAARRAGLLGSDREFAGGRGK